MAEIMDISRILILDRNRLTLRRVTRILTCTGVELVPLEDPAELPRHLDDRPALLCADAVDIATITGVLQTRPEIEVVVWTPDPTDKLLPLAHEQPHLNHLLGRARDRPPREWELLWTVQRVLGRESAESVGPASLLAWGHAGFAETLRTTAQRDSGVGRVVRFCERLNCPGRVRDMLAELAHELLMNAMYGAPVDDAGRAKYAVHRKAHLELEPSEAVTLECASDGMRLLLSVTDPFGRLPREAIFAGMVRGLAGGELDTSRGGAGLGMVYIYNSAAISIFDVRPGRMTRVTGVYELHRNLREFRGLPRSVHYFNRP